jgi:DNA-binding LytR/AlgR family response regulator
MRNDIITKDEQEGGIISNTRQVLRLKTWGGSYEDIDLSELVFIQSQGHYMLYRTVDKVYLSRQYSMKNLLPELPENFVRCNRCYAINKDFIVNIVGNHKFVELEGEEYRIPIGKNIVIR